MFTCPKYIDVLCVPKCLQCISGDGRELFKQDILTQCVKRHILPHVQTDGAYLEKESKRGIRKANDGQNKRDIERETDAGEKNE